MRNGFFTEIGNWVWDENGDLRTPVDSNLGHRFYLEDGEVKDRYNGVSDNSVREIDHEQAMERNVAEIAAWEALPEPKGSRPPDLPPLVLPGEEPEAE
jgi:hypothetical protein